MTTPEFTPATDSLSPTADSPVSEGASQSSAPESSVSEPLTSQPIQLPPRMPKQDYRPAQSNIPDEKALRQKIGELAAHFLEREGIVAPLSMAELQEYGARVILEAGLGSDLRQLCRRPIEQRRVA